MAFQNKNLSAIAYANGFTLWHYAASEPLAEICADGYSDNVKSLTSVGDIFIINASDDTAMRKLISNNPKTITKSL